MGVVFGRMSGVAVLVVGSGTGSVCSRDDATTFVLSWLATTVDGWGAVS